jgi:hypothetical protein
LLEAATRTPRARGPAMAAVSARPPRRGTPPRPGAVSRPREAP